MTDQIAETIKLTVNVHTYWIERVVVLNSGSATNIQYMSGYEVIAVGKITKPINLQMIGWIDVVLPNSGSTTNIQFTSGCEVIAVYKITIPINSQIIKIEILQQKVI